jgi:hypothetical protein
MNGHRELPEPTITPPSVIDPGPAAGEPVDPPADPGQYGEPGAPVAAPKRIERSTDLNVPPNVRSLINSRRRVIE